METFKIGICEPVDFSKKAVEKLSEIGKVFLFNNDMDLKFFISDKNAIFIRLKYAITDELLEQAYNLKYICSRTTGLNHIQVINRKCKVISLKGEYEFLDSIRATPEHVFGLTLSLLRNYSHAFLNEDNSEFNRDLYKGFELYKNHIGIIGLGRVGKIVAQYFKAFGARVFYYDLEDKHICYAEKCVTIKELIQKSNIVILAANYTKENECMISKEQLELLKDKYFINAARGELVNEHLLLEYVKQKWFRGVAIDVISGETQKSDFLKELLKLTSNCNLIITPHIGGATYSSMKRTEEFIVDKLLNELQVGGNRYVTL